MSKNKLQEFAQRNYSCLPVYNSTKEGPDHAPRFRASVTYNGHTYHSPAFFRCVKQAETAAAEAALHALNLKSDHTSNLTNSPVIVKMEPVEVPSNLQKESNKEQKGDRKEETLQQPEVVLPTSQSRMTNVLENSELKAEASKIPQAPPLLSPSSRIHIVSLRGFSVSANSEIRTEKLNTGNISSIPEISGNETIKEQAIQQSEGKILTQFTSVQMEPVEVPLNLQEESKKEQEGDRALKTLQKPEDVSPTYESGMADVLANSELKDETSKIEQAPPVSFSSSRIHVVRLQGFSVTDDSGKGTDNINSLPETLGNKKNKEQEPNMAADMLEERLSNEEVIQQSEGRKSAPQFMSDMLEERLLNEQVIQQSGGRKSTPQFMSDMHKNQLQDFAMRGGFDLPHYSSIREGLPHIPRFKAVVKFNGETFESPGFFNTLRQAEHAAATVALKSLSEKGFSLDESSMYKSLLLEKAQKEGKPSPSYNTTRTGPSHMPVFKCIVKSDGMTFEGTNAKTKKQAEKNAANILWSALKDSRTSSVSTEQMHNDKAKALVCEPNDHEHAQVINHMREEITRKTHGQLSHLDLSKRLSAVSLLAPSEVFDRGSKKELVHNMTTCVLGNRDKDKALQPCNRSSPTKHPSGTRIRVLPGSSSKSEPWVEVNLTANAMQIQNNSAED